MRQRPEDGVAGTAEILLDAGPIDGVDVAGTAEILLDAGPIDGVEVLVGGLVVRDVAELSAAEAEHGRRSALAAWYLFAALGVLQVLDVLSTKAALGSGGDEGNPVMAPVADGVVAPLGIKALGIALVALILSRCPCDSRIVQRGLAAAVGVYVAVVSWNFAVALGQTAALG